MHKQLHTYLLVALALLSGQMLLAAPVASDSASLSPLVPQYLIRRWYTSPDAEPFHPARYGNGLRGISLVGSYNPQIELSTDNENRSFVPQALSVGVLKDFDKSHALRVTFNYNRADYPGAFTDESVHNYTRYSLSFDYLFNLSNYWFGYDPSRSLEALVTAGVTGGLSAADQHRASSEGYLQGQFGLQLRKTLSPRLSLFVEPFYYLATDQYDFYTNGADFDDGMGLKAGLQMRLTPPYRLTPWFPPYQDARWYDNLYFQSLVGANFVYTEGQTQSHPSFSDYNFSVALGRWIAPSYGFRLGVADRQLLSTSNDGRYDHTYRQFTMRAEGVLNLFSLVDRVSVGRVGADISAGLEGTFNRHYASEVEGSKPEQSPVSEKNFKPGVTAAAQLHYFFTPRISLLAEARYSVFGRRDGLFTPALGIEYATSSFPRYHAWTRKGMANIVAASSFKKAKDVDPLASTYQLSRHNLFFEAGLGLQALTNDALGLFQPAPMADFAIGYRFNQYHSVRFRENVAAHYRNKYYGTSADSHHALHYMFDLTNLVFGSEPTRHYSIRPYAGPVYSLNHISQKNKGGDHEWGAEVGLQHTIQLNSNLGIYIEPRYMYQFSDVNCWNLSAGISYTIEHDYQRPFLIGCGSTHGQGESSHLYAQVLGGVQLHYGLARRSSPAYMGSDVTVGHTFGRIFAVQGSLFSAVSTLSSTTHDNAYGIRGEFVGDMLRAIWSGAHNQGWALMGQVGWDYSRSVNTHRSLHGPTAAVQLRRRLFNTPLWAVAQGRFQSTSTRYPRAIWSAQAGLHYELPSTNPRVKPANQRQQQILDRSLSEVNSHPFIISASTTWFDATKMGYNVALGYQFSPLHTIRLGYDHAATDILTCNQEKVRVNAATIDYLFDFSQFLMGRQRTPRLHVLPLAGVSLLFHHFEHSVMTPGKLNLPSSKKYYAIDLGFDIDYRISRHFSVSAGQKFFYAPTDDSLNPDHTRYHRYWHSLANASLKLHL